jgi:hypothetical protein
MKNFTLKVFFVALVALLFGGSQAAKACNLAEVTLCGVYKSPLLNASFPADSMICLRLAVGWGKTGTQLGADSDTRSLSFGWSTHRPPFTIRAFTPDYITSGRGFSNCTMAGSNIGPQGPPYNSHGTVIYIDPGYYGFAPCVTQPFACVTSTALCGNIGQTFYDFRFQVNKIPDSVRVYGIEGGGNPIDGCYPDGDMSFNFTTLAVEWGNIEGIASKNSIKIKWSTMSETNSDLFVVERANNDGGFDEVGTVDAAGYSTSETKYELMDLAPMPGINRYRVLQVDQQGNSAASPAVEVNFAGPAGLVWGAVGPNPAADYLNLTFYNDRSETLSLSVSGLNGKTVIRQDITSIAGANELRLALDKVDAGAYFVTLQGANQKLTRKIVKL